MSSEYKYEVVTILGVDYVEQKHLLAYAAAAEKAIAKQRERIQELESALQIRKSFRECPDCEWCIDDGIDHNESCSHYAVEASVLTEDKE